MARYLFDENCSRRVARVVRRLYEFSGVDVGWVGRVKGGDPPLGSTDECIRRHTCRARQAIITQDLGMIRQCVEYDQPVIWIDRKGRKSILEETVKMTILVLRSVPKWERMLNLDIVPDIIRTNSRGTEALTLEGFRDIMGQRMKYSALARKRKSNPRTKTDGGLLAEVKGNSR